jgi:FkbM family methyltransferase
MLNHIRTFRRYFTASKRSRNWGLDRFPLWAGPAWHRDYVNGFINVLADFPAPRDAKTIVDIGANVGLFAKACEIYFPAANILAFEPSIVAFQQLIERCGPNVTPIKRAVGAAPGTATLHIAQHLAASSLIPPNKECKAIASGKMKASGETENVAVTTLDCIARENEFKHIDFLKIDVEGFEPEVLAGGGKTLEDKVDRIMIEISVARLGTEQGMNILHHLFEMGYRLVNLTDVHRSDTYIVAPVVHFDAWLVHSRLIPGG